MLKTKDGKEILDEKAVEKIRAEESKKKESNVFVAQKGAQETGLGFDADIVVFGGNRGGGKANPYTTPVLTPGGWVKMGDLQVGDYVCTPYEGPQRITEIFEQGPQATFAFTFDDGTKLTCTREHRFWGRTSPEEEFHEMTGDDIIKIVRPDIPYPISLRPGHYFFPEIPLCGEVNINPKKDITDLPLHPYILGFISHTGFWEFKKTGVVLGNDQYMARSLMRYGTIHRNRYTKKYVLTGISDEVRKYFTPFRTRQPAYIPTEYKIAPVEARWMYLRGLLYVPGRSKNRHPYVDLPNLKLCEDVAEMARSLGIWVTVAPVPPEDGKVGYTRVTFVAPDDSLLFQKVCFRRKAKVNAEKATNPYNQNVLVKRIVSVTHSGRRTPCRCITISGKHHLYLTNDYNINHNTVTMLMEPMYDIENKHFNGIILRKNKDDFENIINESKRWFEHLGKYNKSKDDMTWYFKSGAKLGLSYYDMPMSDFDIKYRGQQYAYIGVDELPQMPFEMFKFLMTSNRNTVGVHSRMFGTCNPDPISWLRKFLDWWIGKADTVYSDGKMHPERKGFAIPERDGKVRYCYMPDDSVDNIVWGNTPEEVYEQCKDLIDDAWDPEWEQYGYTKTSFFVKSVIFKKAALNENKALIKNDPSYIASLLNQPPEIRAREFEGNWDIIKVGEDMIQAYHLDKIFDNAQMLGDKVRRATCDVAGTGGDNCVTWLWVGWHVADVFVTRRDPYTTAQLLKSKLQEWGVTEENFTYDLNGMGQVLKGPFPRAVPFNNIEAVDQKFKFMYDNKKSQCAFRFAERTRQGDWSMEKSLLDRTYMIGKETHSLYDILQRERKCVKKDMNKSDKGDCLISKEQMKHKSIVGHSPDFFEALFMREIFELKGSAVSVPSWLQKGGSKGFRSVRKLTHK